jgi:hypothetical protein
MTARVSLLALLVALPALGGARLALSQSVWDIGDVKPEQRPQHVLTVTNTGDAATTLRTVRPSCSCLDVAIDRTALAPGEAARITVTVNPSKRRGAASSRIHIAADAGVKPQAFEVRFQLARPPAPALAALADADIGLLVAGESRAVPLRLENVGALPLTVSATTIDRQPTLAWAAAAPALPLTLAPGDVVEWQLAYTPARTGLQQAALTVTSNDPKHRRRHFAVTAYVATPEDLRAALHRGSADSAAHSATESQDALVHTLETAHER